jgi:hypothetical protein
VLVIFVKYSGFDLPLCVDKQFVEPSRFFFLLSVLVILYLSFIVF